MTLLSTLLFWPGCAVRLWSWTSGSNNYKVRGSTLHIPQPLIGDYLNSSHRSVQTETALEWKAMEKSTRGRLIYTIYHCVLNELFTNYLSHMTLIIWIWISVGLWILLLLQWISSSPRFGPTSIGSVLAVAEPSIGVSDQNIYFYPHPSTIHPSIHPSVRPGSECRSSCVFSLGMTD